MPGLLDFLGFAFFAPTLIVGPISSYSTFHNSLQKRDLSLTPLGTSCLRVLVGATKILFLSCILDRLSYKAFLLDGHPHALADLAVAAVAYYLYIYCNFSGFCDIAIGLSGTAGIKVSENFDEPLAARNVKDFWNRWHITLSHFMRDLVFSPLSKTLLSSLPEKLAVHAVPITILIVFILIGIWHGRELNFVIFGILHALGVASNYYYDLILKKFLSRDQLRDYNKNRFVRLAAICMTFGFICITFFVFANSPEKMKEILAAVKW